jgi:crotonobetainyl-CoA:carnitine CoA-transferase CaiB-like acyl-CoA transferase
LTPKGRILGGGSPFYNLYRTSDGWIAVAALEPRFAERLLAEFELIAPDRDALEKAFRRRSAAEWETWAAERDLPIVAVR